MENLFNINWILDHSRDIFFFFFLLFIKSSLMVLAALAFLRIFKSASSSTRHLVWTLTLISLLLLPVFTLVFPSWNIFHYEESAGTSMEQPVGKPESPVDHTAVKQQPIVQKSTDPGLNATSPENKPAMTEPSSSTSGFMDLFTLQNATLLLLSIWIVGMVIILLRQILGRLIVWRLTLQSDDVLNQSLINMQNTLRLKANILRPVQLLKSNKTNVPMSWGITNPKILLPEAVNGWDEHHQRYVLLHELAHIKRFDSLTQVIAQLAQAIYWFNPLVHLAHNRFVLEREHACDDYVLIDGSKPSEYATLLLNIARSFDPLRFTSFSTVTMARKSQIEGRLISILNPKSNRHQLQRILVWGLGLAVMLTTIPMAMISTAPARQAAVAADSTIILIPEEKVQERQARKEMEDVESNGDIDLSMETNLAEKESRVEMATEIEMIEQEALSRVEAEALVEPQVQVKIEREALRESAKFHSKQERNTDEPYPDYVVDALEEAIKDPELDVRLQAIETLGEIGDARVIPALSGALKDPDDRVRKNAAEALGDIEDMEAVAPLSDLVKDESKEVRRAVVSALGDIEHPSALRPLAQALKDSDWEIRKTAAYALGDIGAPEAVDALTQVLDDDNKEVRKYAVWALGEIEVQKAVEPLKQALKDEDWEVRKNAVDALEEIGDHQSGSAITPLLQDNHHEVRKTAAWALGEMEVDLAVVPLGNALSDGHWEVRKQAAWALGEIENPAAIDLLSKSISDPHPEVRKNVVWALGELEDVRSIKPLVKALDDEVPSIRKTAAWALGDIGDASVMDALIKASGDDHQEVRKSVMWAFGEIRDVRAVNTLLEALADESWEVRKQAAWALGEIGDTRAIEPLTKALKDEHNEVRRQAARALGNIRWEE